MHNATVTSARNDLIAISPSAHDGRDGIDRRPMRTIGRKPQTYGATLRFRLWTTLFHDTTKGAVPHNTALERSLNGTAADALRRLHSKMKSERERNKVCAPLFQNAGTTGEFPVSGVMY